MRMHPIALTILVLVPVLGGCRGADEDAARVRENDPALASALAAPITYDPDLASMNRANSAASLPPQDGFLPTLDGGAEAIAAARAEAVALVGGPGQMRQAPDPAASDDRITPAARLTAAGFAAAVPGAEPVCARQARYTMQWAARLPAAFPVYPRAAVEEAAGVESRDCRLRVIKFVTPVPIEDVIDFYYTRARRAGYSATRTRQEDTEVLSGATRAASYLVYARERDGGTTEVDLITR